MTVKTQKTVKILAQSAAYGYICHSLCINFSIILCITFQQLSVHTVVRFTMICPLPLANNIIIDTINSQSVYWASNSTNGVRLWSVHMLMVSVGCCHSDGNHAWRRSSSSWRHYVTTRPSSQAVTSDARCITGWRRLPWSHLSVCDDVRRT